MAKEMVDKYNQYGEKIGVVNKDIAHKLGLWHKSVHVWIINNNNEILLQYRCSDKSLYPNTWDVSFAGHVSAGESSIDAVLREGKEELGINVDLDKLEYILTNRENLQYDNINSNEFVDIYILRQNVDVNKIILQEEEVSDAAYVSKKQFFNLMNTDQLVPHEIEYKVLKKYYRKKLLQ